MLLDWQTSSVQSPAIDLANFVFASTDRTMRAQHFDALLRLYHDELRGVANVCGSNAAAMFSHGDLMDQMREFSGDTLAHLQCVLPFLVTPPDELNSLSDLMDNVDNASNADANKQTIAPLNKETAIVYRERLTDVIADFRRLGLI